MNLIKETSGYIQKWYQLKLKAFRKKWAIIQANDQRRATGRQFVVVEYGNTFHVLDNRTRKHMNRRNKKYHHITWKSMIENSVYITK